VLMVGRPADQELGRAKSADPDSIAQVLVAGVDFRPWLRRGARAKSPAADDRSDSRLAGPFEGSKAPSRVPLGLRRHQYQPG